MSVNPGYRQTPVGILPHDWRCANITDVAKLESGHTPSKRVAAYWDGDIPWISLHDTDALDDMFIHSTVRTITDAGVKNSSARMLPHGTVIFSRTATVGKAALMGREMCTSQDFANYICGPELHNQFLVYLFRSMSAAWKRVMAGSVHNTIYMPVFKSLQIPLPPLPEQRAIAEALGDVDALLASLDRLIAKKRDIKQAVMQQILTGKTRLPGFSGEWKVKQWGTIATVRNEKVVTFGNPVASNCIELEQIEQDTGRVSDFSDASGRRTTKYSFKPGDVLFGRLRPYLRKFWFADRDGVCSTEIWPLIPVRDSVISSYLFQVVRTDAFIEAANSSYGTHMPRSDWKALTKFEVAIPQDLEEQAAIAKTLADFDQEVQTLDARRNKTRLLKQGMMQELLTGRTRLV